jgi:hypothetical protein
MKIYRNPDKRKEYKKQWAREKALKDKAIEAMVETSVEPIFHPESTYCILFNKMRKIREDNKLSNFSYWMINVRRMNKDFMYRYGKYMNRDTVVQVVPPITDLQIICGICYIPLAQFENTKQQEEMNEDHFYMSNHNDYMHSHAI